MGELQVSPDQMATLSFPQLQSAIDKCKASVEVLKPIEKKGRIIDFEIIMVNNRAERNEGEHYAIGRKIAGTDHPAANMIERLIEVAQNGSSFENIISAEIKGNTYDFKQIIYPTNLGLIISREKIDTVTTPVAKKESTPGNLQSAL